MKFISRATIGSALFNFFQQRFWTNIFSVHPKNERISQHKICDDSLCIYPLWLSYHRS